MLVLFARTIFLAFKLFTMFLATLNLSFTNNLQRAKNHSFLVEAMQLDPSLEDQDHVTGEEIIFIPGYGEVKV
jgi:hypothetical protein